MRILVIEDNADIKEVLDYILNDDGHEVIASSDETPLSSLDTIKPDIILLDDILGGVRGSALCRQLKNDAETSSVPVILISAMPNLKETAARSGADAYIEKPFNVDELIGVIKRFA